MHRDQLALICCVVCSRWYVVRVNSDDLRRHHDGVLVQDAFPYLPRNIAIAHRREVRYCWAVLCWSNPLAYS